MSKERENEPPLQYDLFSGALVDNRTEAQKKRDREREQPQPMEMFSARDVAQFGVNPRPLIPLSDHTRLTLEAEDPRSDEERERDRQRAAEAATYKLFTAEPGLYGEQDETPPGWQNVNANTALDDEAEDNPGVTRPSEASDVEDVERATRARFFNVLAREAYPNGANNRTDMPPGALAQLSRQVVAHVRKEVARPGFWSLDWVQTSLRDRVWDFLEQHYITEGDVQRCDAAADGILEVARQLWGTGEESQPDDVPGPEPGHLSEDVPLALVVYGYFDHLWKQLTGDDTEPEPAPIPISWICREDLLYCRPEYEDEIAALGDSELAHIAEKVGDALQETYWLAMSTVLEHYFQKELRQKVAPK